MAKSKWVGLCVMLLLSATCAVTRAGDCCSQCQRQCACSKVCRLVNEERKVDVVCWGCVCEEFCVPDPSCLKCEHCETVCDPCLEKAAAEKAAAEKSDGAKAESKKPTPVTKPKKFVWKSWVPSGADIFTKKKLMKKVTTKKIPSYKWVVEDLCPECQAAAKSAPVEPGTKAPDPPKTDAKVIQP